MTWMFEKIYQADVVGKQMAFDGKYVWVTTGTQIKIYDYWGEQNEFDPTFEEDDIIHGLDARSGLELVQTIETPLGSHWIVRGGNSMFVADGLTFSNITEIDIATRVETGVIQCIKDADPTVTCFAAALDPEVMNSNLLYDNDKLWMVNAAQEDQTGVDRQKLYFYDIKTQVWDTTEIPTRKQLARAFLSAPYNGSVYVTNFNNVAVSKFNAYTGAFVASIRVNAFPTRMYATPDRNLYVCSFGGMVSKVNTSTNAVTHDHSTLSDAKAFVVEPGDARYWFVNANEQVGKGETVDNKLKFSRVPGTTGYGHDDDTPTEIYKAGGTYDLQKDWELDVTKFNDADFDSMMITPGFTYLQWVSGSTFRTIVVKPFLFVTGAGKLSAIRLDKPLYRDAELSVMGVSMISTGAEDYMGEIG